MQSLTVIILLLLQQTDVPDDVIAVIRVDTEHTLASSRSSPSWQIENNKYSDLTEASSSSPQSGE